MDVKVVAEQKLVALRATEVVGVGWPKGRQSAEVGRTNNNWAANLQKGKELDCPIKQGKFRTF